MKLSLINGKRKKIIILLFFIIIVLAIVLFFINYHTKDSGLEIMVEIKTEKEIYARGEQIGFIVANKGSKPVWYIAPSSKCKGNLIWSVLAGSDDTWDIIDEFPKCEIIDENYNLTEIRILNPNESISEAWDQKLFSGITEGFYAKPGKYKILFYYSGEMIEKSKIERRETDPNANGTYSFEFEISKDFYDEGARDKIQKKNDENRKNDLSKIKKSLEIYFEENDRKYPASAGIEKLNDKNAEIYRILSGYMDEGSLYDPNSPEFYYGYSSDGISFELSARLENQEDENCEVLGEGLCIYRIDSSGNVSKKKYDLAEVLTVKDPYAFFMEKLKIMDINKKNTLIVTSDVMDSSEKYMIDQGGYSLSESVKTKKASEVSRDDLNSYNIILIGSPESNSVIGQITNKATMINIVEGIDVERNSIKTTVKFTKNPWNSEKNVLILETDYSMGLSLLIKGSIEIEKRGDFDHIVIKSDSGKIYALVVSSDGSGFYVEDLSEFDGKYVEIKGYERIRKSQKYPIEDSIGIIDIRALE